MHCHLHRGDWSFHLTNEKKKNSFLSITGKILSHEMTEIVSPTSVSTATRDPATIEQTGQPGCTPMIKLDRRRPYSVMLGTLIYVFETASLAKWLRRPPRERKTPGSNPACAGIFSGSSHTSDFKIGTPVATLPGA